MSRTYSRAALEQPVWQDPPASAVDGRRSTSHEHLADALRDRPGEWALIARYQTRDRASSVASHIRRGRAAAWEPAGAFEAAFDGGDLYARYVKEEQ